MNKEFHYYGNTTVCYLYDKFTNKVFKGVSVCTSQDTYNKKLGEDIAKLKALHKLQTFKMKLFSSLIDEIENWKSVEEDVREQYQNVSAKAERTFKRLTELTYGLKKEENDE